jgi:hypothetical protein
MNMVRHANWIKVLKNRKLNKKVLLRALVERAGQIKGIIRGITTFFEIEKVKYFRSAWEISSVHDYFVSRTKLFSDCWAGSLTCCAAGRDLAFSYGSVYPKETATKTWDHAVPSHPLEQAWLVQTDVLFTESIQHGKYRNGNVEITRTCSQACPGFMRGSL